MTFITTITQKGQITIPKQMREFLGLKTGFNVELALDQKQTLVKVSPLPKLSDLAGSFKPKKPQDPIKLRAYMEKHYQRI